MEYQNIRKNNKGYQVSFQCAECGKYFSLNEMHYFEHGDIRVCDHCFKSYQDKRTKMKPIENKEIMERIIESRITTEISDDEEEDIDE